MKPLVLAGTSDASVPALIVALLSFSGLALSPLGRAYAEPMLPAR